MPRGCWLTVNLQALTEENRGHVDFDPTKPGNVLIFYETIHRKYIVERH